MDEFLALALSFPTVVFSTLLLVVLAYWCFVILGALDIDAFDFDADLDPDVDLDLDLDADVDVDADLDVDADMDADVDGDIDGHAHGLGLGNIVNALGLGGVPITIVFSALVLFGWVLSMLVTGPLWGSISGGVLGVGMGSLLGLAAFVGAIPLASAATRPLKGLFVVHQAPRRKTFVGRTCTVTTQRVDDHFGQAEIADGGAGLLVQVRCNRENELTKDSEAIVFEYDRKREVYLVAPIGDARLAVDED